MTSTRTTGAPNYIAMIHLTAGKLQTGLTHAK